MIRAILIFTALAFTGLLPLAAQSALVAGPPSMSVPSPDHNYLAAIDWNSRSHFTILQIINSAKNSQVVQTDKDDLAKFFAFGIGPRFAVHGEWSSDSHYFVMATTIASLDRPMPDDSYVFSVRDGTLHVLSNPVDGHQALTFAFVDTHKIKLTRGTQSIIVDLDRVISKLPKRALLQKGDWSGNAADTQTDPVVPQ